MSQLKNIRWTFSTLIIQILKQTRINSNWEIWYKNFATLCHLTRNAWMQNAEPFSHSFNYEIFTKLRQHILWMCKLIFSKKIRNWHFRQIEKNEWSRVPKKQLNTINFSSIFRYKFQNAYGVEKKYLSYSFHLVFLNLFILIFISSLFLLFTLKIKLIRCYILF